MASKMKYTKGERLNIRFNCKIKFEFHGARLTSDGGLLAYRELDDALELFNSASTVMNDKRTGRNIQHDMTNLLRQSVYSRRAGYEDVNDAERLSVDPSILQNTVLGMNNKPLESRIYSFVKLIWGIFIFVQM